MLLSPIRLTFADIFSLHFLISFRASQLHSPPSFSFHRNRQPYTKLKLIRSAVCSILDSFSG